MRKMWAFAALPTANTSDAEFSVAGAPRYDTSSPMRWVLSHIAHHRWLTAAFFALSLVNNVASSVAALLTGQAAMEMVKPERGRLGECALGIFGALSIGALANLFGSFSAENIAKGVQANVRKELCESLLGKDHAFHGAHRVGDMMARATEDSFRLSLMIVPGLSLVLQGLIAIFVPCAFLGVIAPALLLVPCAFVGAHVAALSGYVRQLGPVLVRQRQVFGNLNACLQEVVSGIETVKAAAREEFERGKYRTLARELRDLGVAQGEIEARYLPALLFAVATGALFLQCFWLYGRGSLSLPEIIAAMWLMAALRFPAFISIFTFAFVQGGIASAERILDVIRSRASVGENVAGFAGPVRGQIEFKNVCLRHGDRTVLENLSFNVAAGDTVAIVGQAGAGKTTMTGLVNRMYDPTEGQVLIDGVDTRNWNLSALRSAVGKIEQDVFLFSRSVGANIAFARPGAAPSQIRQAAEAACAHQFVSELEQGYDTVLGPRGMTLSGGQRQRIGLARAFLSDPRILILDDSTSAIDSATEEEIQRALRRIQKGRTTLLITHRMSMVRWADVIIVLDAGRVVALGRHDQLLRTSPEYRRMFARYDTALPPLHAMGHSK